MKQGSLVNFNRALGPKTRMAALLDPAKNLSERNVKSGKRVAGIEPTFLKLPLGDEGDLAKREKKEKLKKKNDGLHPSLRSREGVGRGGGWPISDLPPGKNTPSPSAAILKNEPPLGDRNQWCQLRRRPH